MPIGSYEVDLDIVAIDACGDTETDSDRTGGDRVDVLPPSGLAVGPGIDITAWGPIRNTRPRR